MRNVADEICTENRNTCYVQKYSFFFENHYVSEIMWKKIVKPGIPQIGNRTRCIRIACWIPKAANTHSDYVILIDFPLCNNGRSRARHCYVTRAVHCLSCVGFARNALFTLTTLLIGTFSSIPITTYN